MLKKTKIKIYILIGILILALLYTLKNTSYFIRVLGFISAIALFYLFDFCFHLKFKNKHYFLIVFITATGILLSPLYFVYPHYDKILHFINPFLISILIFFLVNKLKTSFSIKLILTASITLSLLGLFEIGEFLIDRIFDWKLQGVYLRDYSGIAKLRIIQDRNDDTMIDLILGTIGTIVFIAIKTIDYYLFKRNSN